MSFDLTPERTAYLDATGKVVLNACPGSGKTTTVAQKLVHLVQSYNNSHSYSGGIACLSFTNVAKDEIANKYRETSGFPLVYPHIISTIDSFVNNFITLPFVHKVMNIGKRFRIVDDMTFIDRLFVNNGQFLRKYGALIHRFPPHKIDYTINCGVSWDGHDKNSDAAFVEYGIAVKKYQWNAGLLKTSDSALIALQLLKKFPQVSKYLSSRYPYLIIDEAQDTSEIQHAIIDKLISGNLSNIDLVGDPYQCLYQWRDASPDLFLHKFDDIVNWQGLCLSENRRSTQKIVNIYSPLRRKGEKPIVSANNSLTDLPLHLLKYGTGTHSDAISKYENLCKTHSFQINRILVRGNSMRNNLLGCPDDFKPWNLPLPYILVESKIHLESSEIKVSIRNIKRLIISLINPNFNFQELKDSEELLQNDHILHASLFSLIRGLPNFDLSIRQWTIETQQYLKDQLQLTALPDFKIRKKTSENLDIKVLENPVRNYFKKATTENNIPITTIHQVKGMTFDSVLLVLSEDSKGQNISLKDIKEPDNLPSEKQRLIYVAMSRPSKLLCLGVPNTISNEELKSKFGNDIIIL